MRKCLSWSPSSQCCARVLVLAKPVHLASHVCHHAGLRTSSCNPPMKQSQQAASMQATAGLSEYSLYSLPHLSPMKGGTGSWQVRPSHGTQRKSKTDATPGRAPPCKAQAEEGGSKWLTTKRCGPKRSISARGRSTARGCHRRQTHSLRELARPRISSLGSVRHHRLAYGRISWPGAMLHASWIQT